MDRATLVAVLEARERLVSISDSDVDGDVASRLLNAEEALDGILLNELEAEHLAQADSEEADR